MVFKVAKDFDTSGAGAKDTEWIGPIYGARFVHAGKFSGFVFGLFFLRGNEKFHFFRGN